MENILNVFDLLLATISSILNILRLKNIQKKHLNEAESFRSFDIYSKKSQ